MESSQFRSNQDNLSSNTLLATEHRDFCTGSSYTGEWDDYERMHGKGVYRFPDGAEYYGQFKHGVFHGDGYIVFPNKYKVRAHWDNGKMGSYEIIFPDDLKFVEKNWTYCTKADRRYAACIRNGIPAVGDGYLTKDKLPRQIPPGCYDIEEGFYNPKTELLYSIHDPNLAVRVPSSEGGWVVQNCRKSVEETVGYLGAVNIIRDMKEQMDDRIEIYQYTEQ